MSSRALIGRAVRRLRAERGMTQQALAVRLGISARYLNLIEHERRAVTASLLIKLAAVLRVGAPSPGPLTCIKLSAPSLGENVVGQARIAGGTP